ncbi:ATPase, AAA family [Bacteriovorax sp. BSW11_IV]|uniref:AAA family ATPase n=1 Tax=Bacteriovorax sp. BSW11_IV TaxID=1353529 RepID=UPI00038A442C|nr:AAA family ATPase [Bacteriovorax sp. BSW11_IV]EQC42942.1 ATPase, AAA family [Bacteriovorax sp. BSW11_IV]
MKRIFIVLLYLIPFISFANSTCPVKSKLIDQYETKKDFYSKSIEGIDQILSGNFTTQMPLTTIFGPEIAGEDVQTLITTYKKQVEDISHVPDELEYLANCLREVKEDTKYIELINSWRRLYLKKIELLEKNSNLDSLLKKTMANAQALPEFADKISREKEQDEKLKQEITEKISDTQAQMVATEDQNLKDIKAAIVELEKVKVQILNINLAQAKILEDELRFYKDKSLVVGRVSGEIDKIKGVALEDTFFEVTTIWEDVVKKGFHLFSKQLKSLNFPEMPSRSNFAESSDEAKKEIENINRVVLEIENLKEKTLASISLKSDQELQMHYNLLFQVSSTRQALYERLGKSFIFEKVFTMRFWQDLKYELLSVPYKIVSFLYSRVIYVKDALSLGKKGVRRLIFDGLGFVVFLLGLYVISLGVNYSEHKIDKVKSALLISEKFRSTGRLFSIWWQRLRPAYRLLLWLYITYLIENHYYFTHIEDLRFIIPFVQVFIVYSIFKIAIVGFLSSIAILEIRNIHAFRIKAYHSANSLGKIFLYYFISLILLEESLGKVYVYSIISLMAFGLTLYRVSILATDWHDTILRFLEKKVSTKVYTLIEMIEKKCPPWMASFVLLIISVIVMLFNVFISLTENLEVSKKLSAKLFRRQLENIEVATVEVGRDKLPQDYLDIFTIRSLEESDLLIAPDPQLSQGICDEINEWLGERAEEHSLVLYGDKGVGKTTLMKYVMSTYEDNNDVNVIYHKVPAKLATRDGLRNYIKELLGFKEEERFDILSIDNRLEKKTVVFLDEVQNVFLSRSGGFEAYNELINLVNLGTKNIFWCFSFNRYSWIYLDRAFGRNQFFRNVFALSGWSDERIKELIMKRHNKTDYKLSFDFLISATNGSEEIDSYASIESRFFKLLWELSNGNPRCAISLWVSALRKRGEKSFVVNVPKLYDGDELMGLSDDTLFVLAEVLKHENLSAKEITLTTYLPIGLVRNAIKVASEGGLLYKDTRGRFMLDILSQYSIIKFLKSKNFIYGN